ncbi:EcsC family protein [Olivibacter domesticus]|uniref:EcsC protein family protein n=1 Tax=Olivibacter domesticus TaxID=407022 RepID=A0A1H7HRC0_OLID1|nr:EcsC family protein [Olivibacter domesticus]SEK52809.1 EcsC protein family protein [Olivibacter domesticus]
MSMDSYENKVFKEMVQWNEKMLRSPSKGNRFTKGIQDRINNMIPEKAHQIITLTIEKMVKAVLFSSKYITTPLRKEGSLQIREAYIKRTIRHYKNAATVEGAITGAGGILMGFADFPAFLAIKIKMLFEIAALYGFNVKDYRERLFILHIFQISFCSQQKRNKQVEKIENWKSYSDSLPADVDDFDWRSFQQEYRDYIDLAKMAQLIPVIGAVVGAIANNKLTEQLGQTALNCYRNRYFKQDKLD